MSNPGAADEAAIRDALEDAYRRKGGTDPSAVELFAYASNLPDGADAERVRTVARGVLADPPEMKKPNAPASGWEKADFGRTNPGVYPPNHRSYDAWMVRMDGKQPYAPWSSRDAPAPCREHNTTADNCDCDARWKWGFEKNRNSFENAKQSLEDNRFEGLAFIQTEADPFVFVDGDDVRDPDTGDVHPAFVAILEHLGLTYADVSTSGAGVHAYYRGALPEDETAATWQIDTEPFGANDDLPAIEFYSGKHVCLTTGDHVDGTPLEVTRWNGEVLRSLLEANDEFTQTTTTTDSRPSSRSSGTSSGSDPIRAVNRLDARDVAEKTIVDDWTGGGGAGDTFLPTWGNSGDGGTANFVDETCWVDTGTNGGRGGPIEMAMIDLGELRNTRSEVGCVTGADFWTAYDHLRDLGFSLPDPNRGGGADDKSDYYEADLGAYVDGDPWSDPDAMLEACLSAREAGAVASEAEPPALALIPITRDLLGVEKPSAATREEAVEVFHDMSSDDHDGKKVVL